MSHTNSRALQELGSVMVFSSHKTFDTRTQDGTAPEDAMTYWSAWWSRDQYASHLRILAWKYVLSHNISYDRPNIGTLSY